MFVHRYNAEPRGHKVPRGREIANVRGKREITKFFGRKMHKKSFLTFILSSTRRQLPHSMRYSSLVLSLKALLTQVSLQVGNREFYINVITAHIAYITECKTTVFRL